MPVGMVLWCWEERLGPDVLVQYPNGVSMDHKTLMQLYSQHLYSAIADIVSLFVGSLNLVSLWTGSTHNYFLTILLHSEENGEDYREVIIDAMDYLIPYIKKQIFEPIIGPLYNRICQYTTANFEQKMAMLYINDENRMVLNMLQEEGAFFVDEMKIWLEDRLNTRVFDFEMMIDRLSRMGFIKLENVKGLDGTYAFLLRHLMIFRVPPPIFDEKSGLVHDRKIQEKVNNEVQKYFKYYHPTDKDSLDLANVLCDMNYFKIISLLRQTITLRDNIYKLRLHNVTDPLDNIKELERLDIVCSFKNDAGEWVYALKSDIVVDCDIPEYILNTMYGMYKSEAKSRNLISIYLNILRNTFIDQTKQKSKKNKKNQKVPESTKTIIKPIVPTSVGKIEKQGIEISELENNSNP
jgi:hypothetical protein